VAEHCKPDKGVSVRGNRRASGIAGRKDAESFFASLSNGIAYDAHVRLLPADRYNNLKSEKKKKPKLSVSGMFAEFASK
jgi:hypothetical protein